MRETPLILIVDDDSSSRQLLTIILERAGYKTQQAESGEVALEMAREDTPDLIILDDILPGIWGDQVREHLKSNPDTRNIKVVMHTGQYEKIPMYQQYQESREIAGVISKPSMPASLLDTVRHCINSE
jgi:CheY-like chemotaxis protein